ncbi:MAG TPA: vWA domain-containing protein [Terriglobales bacterium]|jgi:hypothetical protein|nr:vWA domain-containing protein [Terriglobales bacterium]
MIRFHCMNRLIIAAFALLPLAHHSLVGPSTAYAEECSWTVPVSAIDHLSERAVLDLNALHLRAKIDGRNASIGEVQAPPVGRLVVVLDFSASTQGWSPQLTAMQGLVRAVLRAAEGWSVSLVSYATRIGSSTEFRPATDVLPIAATIPAPAGKGRLTATYDALAHAVSKFAERQLGDTILLISDGEEDNASRTRLKDLRRLLADREVRLFVVNTWRLDVGYPDVDQAFLQSFAANGPLITRLPAYEWHRREPWCGPLCRTEMRPIVFNFPRQSSPLFGLARDTGGEVIVALITQQPEEDYSKSALLPAIIRPHLVEVRVDRRASGRPIEIHVVNDKGRRQRELDVLQPRVLTGQPNCQ